MSAVLLNGKFVKDAAIDPAKHKFLGMFRPPVNPVWNASAIVLCSCGHKLWTREAGALHYKQGCFDVPQYVDIGENP
jgi:hypothetical protein